jgi:nucleotide-binding universal stress UspA family protein
LAAETGAELVLLHVLPSLAAYAVPELSGALSVSLQRKTRVAAQRQLRRLETQVKGPNFRVHTVLTEGVPFDQIIRAAKRLRCDLIVLATHGRTGLAHAIMGSVAENVVRRAPCPVLTVRPQKLQRAL